MPATISLLKDSARKIGVSVKYEDVEEKVQVEILFVAVGIFLFWEKVWRLRHPREEYPVRDLCKKVNALLWLLPMAISQVLSEVSSGNT